MAERIVCFDLETTGFKYEDGERIIEIGAVEIVDNKITDNNFHCYINPDGKVIELESFNVHKLSNEFLSDKPLFCDVAPKFLEFVGDSPLVAHNGVGFDFPFLNYELKNIGLPEIDSARQLDTLLMARKRIAEIKRYTLDSLADWFGVDKTARAEGHGALIDTEILAEVYLHLISRPELQTQAEVMQLFDEKMKNLVAQNRPKREFSLSQEEVDAHKKWIQDNIKGQFWYENPDEKKN